MISKKQAKERVIEKAIYSRVKFFHCVLTGNIFNRVLRNINIQIHDSLLGLLGLRERE